MTSIRALPAHDLRHAIAAAPPRRIGAALAALALIALAGCASVSRPGRDGPMPDTPPDLVSTPNAEPRVEPLRSGGPNKPYEIGGRNYTPLTRDVPLSERGLASWYGRKFHGRQTASGELYNMYAMTAAHPTMPLPSYARVRNPANGREVIVRVNDRGPFHPGRIIDLSYTAALRLGVLNAVAPVEVERLTFEDIRTGAWRREGDTRLASAAAPAPGGAAVADSQPLQGTTSASSTGQTAGIPQQASGTTPAPSAALQTSGLASAKSAAPTPATPEAGADAGPAVTTPVAAPSAAEVTPLPADAAPTPAPIEQGPPARAGTAAGRGYWVQLGAFRQRAGAEDTQQRVARELEWLAPLLAVFNDAPLHRLQAGPYPTRAEAGAVAERVRAALKLVPVIVERR